MVIPIRGPAEQAERLLAALDSITEYGRYSLSPRSRALREIRAMLTPYPQRPPQYFEPGCADTAFLTLLRSL